MTSGQLGTIASNKEASLWSLSVALVLLGMLTVTAFAAEPYCAFEIKVVSALGRPVPNLSVVLVRGDKTTYAQTSTDRAGVARLCDAPLESVSIAAGRDVAD